MAKLFRSGSNFWAALLAIVSLLGFGVILLILFGGALRVHLPPTALWGVIAALMILFLVALGIGANQMWYGVLIDVRNRVSLSRLQITLWTIMALSAYLAIALPRSMPNALGKPSPEAVAECQALHIKNVEQVDDLDALRAVNPEAAADAEQNAAAACTPHPLNITFPAELIVAMGISTASFAGSTIVQATKRNKRAYGLITDLKKVVAKAEEESKKKDKAYIEMSEQLGAATRAMKEMEAKINDPEATDAEKADARATLNTARQAMNRIAMPPGGDPKAKSAINIADEERAAARKAYEEANAKWEEEDKKKEGLLKVNEKPQQAVLGDLFQGDEIGNYLLIDLSKVQMFFFTLAILVAYGVALASLLGDRVSLFNPIGVNLPAFSSSLNALLGISHAGYLTVKSVDQTKTET
ncbi:MAG: hypothetical protein L0Z70_06795 [Chloroflexi bacterium]|nr:hypothetical protein [Chloroflexota bacterium]